VRTDSLSIFIGILSIKKGIAMKASNTTVTLISNTYPTREGWLQAAIGELRPDFEKLGTPLPPKIRSAIAFTSTGKRGQMQGECWHPVSSDDQHFEIFIRPDMADPIDVLGELTHQLIHAVLLPEAKHGKEFRKLAHRIGLEGQMRHTRPTPLFRERLQAIAKNLGTLPHAKLNFSHGSDVAKKQTTRHLIAECGKDRCGYRVQISAKWARAALPMCPMNSKHGLLVCDIPDETSTDIVPDNK
jgi:hypothetical protein